MVFCKQTWEGVLTIGSFYHQCSLQIFFPNRTRCHITLYLSLALRGQWAASGTDTSLYLPVTSLGSGSSRTLPRLRPGPPSLPIQRPKEAKRRAVTVRGLKERREKIPVLHTQLSHEQGQRLHANSHCPELWHPGHLHPGKGGAHTPRGQVLSSGSGRGSKGLQGPGSCHHFLAQGCETQAAPRGLDTGSGRFSYFENSGSVCNCLPSPSSHRPCCSCHRAGVGS